MNPNHDNPLPPALPFVLLGAMTLVSFGGPFAMLVIIQGGESAKWPPDRPIEWITVGLVVGLAIALFCACISIRIWYSAGADTTRTAPRLPESGDTPNTINRESTGR
jgi:hypothetical protein